MCVKKASAWWCGGITEAAAAMTRAATIAATRDADGPVAAMRPMKGCRVAQSSE